MLLSSGERVSVSVEPCKWIDEELKKNWGGKTGVQQKIADKCRNLNKASNKKNWWN